MRYRLPPLSTLRTFEAAGRHLSFKAASKEVHVTPSAVSHAIQNLEDWLGVKLFVRDPKGLTLTQAGEAYLSYVSQALTLLARGTQGMPGFAPRNVLAISCAPTFAASWLIPNLKSFHDEYPDINVSLDTSHRRVDFPGDDVDLAIRRGVGPWPGLFSEPLAQETVFPVASPQYLHDCGQIQSLKDLENHTIIRVSTITDDWSRWFDEAARPITPRRELSFDALHLAFDAARHGLGVVLGRRPLIDEDLAVGRLVQVLEPKISATTKHWLVCLPEASEWPEISCFRKWIANRLRLTNPQAK